MPLPEITTPEIGAEATTPSTQASVAQEIRSDTLQTLGIKPGPIGVSEDLKPDLIKLVQQFNSILQKPVDQLTKNDGWGQVAGILTYLTSNLEPSRTEAMTLSELYRKTMVYFGNETYLQASGMNDPVHCKGFLDSLRHMEEKAREILHPKNPPPPELLAETIQRTIVG
ncbi:hypothetical protein HZA44_02760 [Candidatus Peregrinibacteria bacterium]|nr:hypothetical protein [Candidatus Peregrinibacteria bacterium]